MQNVRSSRRILGLFTAFCGLILFAFFQNCSGGFSAVRYEALTATCNAARAPFDKEKVPDELANENLPDHPADGATVPKETPVLAVLDNSCRRLREQAGQIEGWIAPEEISIPDIRYQSFSIILPRDFALTELRSIADQDKCVLGLRVNRAFELHSVANDPLMTRQAPDLNSMQAAAAYDMLFPSGTELAQRAVVAVVDSGIRYYDPAYSADLRNYNIEIYHSHPDLQDVFWRDDSGFVGFNFGTELEVFRKYPIDMGSVYRSPTTGQVERTFHGTHVAGIIAASSGNGVGISGVAHNSAVIMPVRVTTDKVLRAAGYDTGSTSSLSILYNAIQYAVEPAGKANGRIADVINISMGSSPIPKSQMFNGIDSVLRSALNLAVSKNASIAVAAGNSNVDLKDYFVQPASLGSTIDGVVTVGSLDTSNMRRSSFSNYGITQVEIAAPGSNILSTINEDEDDPLRPNDPGNTVGYGILSGTSMASPQVAGAMALAVAYLRSHSIAYSPADIESLIVNSAERTDGYVGIGTSDGARNRGRLDLKNLATALMARNAASTGVMAKASPEALHEAAVKREAASVSLFDCP